MGPRYAPQSPHYYVRLCCVLTSMCRRGGQSPEPRRGDNTYSYFICSDNVSVLYQSSMHREAMYWMALTRT